MMKKNLILVLIFFASCARKEDLSKRFNEDKSDGLKQIADYNSCPKNNEISKIDLDILLATNEVNYPIYNVRHKYYYGLKRKIGKHLYLLSYLDSYFQTYKLRSLHDGLDTYLCIYDSGLDKVISKLRIRSIDPVYSWIQFDSKSSDTNRFIIYSFYRDFRFEQDAVEPCIVRYNDTIVTSYQIVNNRFILIENEDSLNKQIILGGYKAW